MPYEPTPQAKSHYESIFEWDAEAASESDRGLALFACSFVEDAMKYCLQAHFVEEPKVVASLLGESSPFAPLQSGSSRRKLLRALGTISSAFDNDIATMAKIRNLFGHRPFLDGNQRLSFDHPKVAKLCARLLVPNTYFYSDGGTYFYFVSKNASPESQRQFADQIANMSNRDRYSRTAYAVVKGLMYAAIDTTRPVQKFEPGFDPDVQRKMDKR